MPKYNSTFNLTVDDMELIEVALRKNVAMQTLDKGTQPEERDFVHRINELLGRLHSQKTFYRPSDKPYVSG